MHAIFDPNVSRHYEPSGAVWPMTKVFAEEMRSDVAFLACEADAVGNALLAAWRRTGLIDVVALAEELYCPREPLDYFGLAERDHEATQGILSEGWASLVSRGYVALNLFNKSWFVTRAGVEAASR